MQSTQENAVPTSQTEQSVKPNATAPDSAPTTVQHNEPEDAYLTGGQRNLQRRVLGLNVEGDQAHRPAEQSPGLHSTGSYTGVADSHDGSGRQANDPSRH
jgi:hypothetical protein